MRLISTAMAFTVRRALFRSSLLVLLASCTEGKEAPSAIPAVYRLASDTAFHRRDGFLYYGQQAFSGRVMELYPSGDTALLFPYRNGKEDGRCLRWHEDGQLSEERFYVQGRKEGIHRGWWPGGQPRFEYHFAVDEYEGSVKEWYRNGTPFRSFTYHKGQEEGRQQLWWENGKVRANYMVRNGEQYGLIGRKLCTNDTVQ